MERTFEFDNAFVIAERKGILANGKVLWTMTIDPKIYTMKIIVPFHADTNERAEDMAKQAYRNWNIEQL